MTPPALASWIARPRPLQPEPLARSASSNMLMDSVPMAAKLESSSALAPSTPPLYMDGASYEVWDLGVRRVDAGPKLRLPLHREELKATFSYVARPSRTRDAYLCRTP